MKNKKTLVIAAILVLILGGGIFAATKMLGGKQTADSEGTTKKKTVLEPKNIIAVAERPYVKLSPVAGGRNIDIEVVELAKPATEVEYELEYQSGTLLQGFQEVLKLGTLPAKTQKLFGSKSAGGAVTYHEDIKGGSLQLRFIGPENYVLKQDWRYFENTAKDTSFGSKDAKFQVESEDLTTNKLIIVYNTPGVAQGLSGEIASDAYSITSDSELEGEADITLRANEEGDLKLMGYNGEEWQEIESTVDGKTVTATAAPLVELYVVVR